MLDCKITHINTISNAENIGNLRMYDDLYLVDYRGGLTVTGSRDASRRLVHGSNIAEILDADGRRILREYLFGYNQKPLFIRTKLGGALVFGGIFPSTSTFLLSFINSDKNDDLERILSSGKIDGVLFPYEGIPAAKIYKRYTGLLHDTMIVLENTTGFINSTIISADFSKNTTIELLNNIIVSAANLVGCEMYLSYGETVVCDNRFDQSAFKAFLLSMLMLCRSQSKKRTAKIDISTCSEGLTVEVRFEPIREFSCITAPEIATFRYFAEMNRMIFENSSDSNQIKIRFCPSRKDWSYIELKAHVEFDWDN